MFRIKHFVLLVALGIGGWIGVRTYVYVCDNTTPEIIVSGVEVQHYYSGDMQCILSASKSGELHLWLDGQPLIAHFKYATPQAEHPFVIPTRTMGNGKHTLKIELTDNTYHKNKTAVSRTFNIDNTPLQAAFIKDHDYRVFQGRTLHVQFQVNKDVRDARIQALASTYDCFPESANSAIYECFIPIPCEENPNEYLFSLELSDHVGNTLTLDNKFQIIAFPFKKQQLTIAPEKVKLEHELGKETIALEQQLEQLCAQSPQKKLWRGPFVAPIDIARVTCDFGAIRTTQEKGRYMHKAVDLINTPKCVVWASQDGVVVLKDRFAASGNTIVIDHGYGLISMYYHLDDFAHIEIGQKITKGNPVGTLGKTGYATGYHLHWEMRLGNIAIDPMQWTKASF